MNVVLRIGLVTLVLFVANSGRAWAGSDVAAAPAREDENVAQAGAKVDVPEWKAKFHETYQLKEGEYVKRVAAPFIPERQAFITPRFPGAPAQSLSGLLTMGVLFAEDDGKTVSYRAVVSTDAIDYSDPTKQVREKRMSLRNVIYMSTGRTTPEVVFDARAKDQDVFMEGDFVIRTGAPLEKLLPDLQKAISLCETENPKSHPLLTLKTEEQEVYVARGEFKIAPRTWRSKGEVDVYADEAVLDKGFSESNPEPHQDVQSTIFAGPRAQFLRVLGGFVNQRIVWDKADLEDPNVPIRVYMHNRWEDKATAAEQSADRDTTRVLRNVSEQIGLTFTKEKRKVQVLHVVTP